MRDVPIHKELNTNDEGMTMDTARRTACTASNSHVCNGDKRSSAGTRRCSRHRRARPHKVACGYADRRGPLSGLSMFSEVRAPARVVLRQGEQVLGTRGTGRDQIRWLVLSQPTGPGYIVQGETNTYVHLSENTHAILQMTKGPKETDARKGR